jgi:hypothetical protein
VNAPKSDEPEKETDLANVHGRDTEIREPLAPKRVSRQHKGKEAEELIGEGAARDAPIANGA